MNLFNKKYFKELLALLVLVWLLNSLALSQDWYYKLNEFDSLVHFVAGAAVGIAFLFVYYSSGIFQPTQKTFTGYLYIAVLGALFVGFGWEIFELANGLTSLADAGYAYDTTLDIIMDSLGAVLVCFYAFAREIAVEKMELKTKALPLDAA